jgi:hypothetical protein
MTAPILKVSVLSTGSLLLDGQPVNLGDLEQAMEQGVAARASVWYYREDAGGPPHPVAMDVMKLIVRFRLPVRLSAKPDFSDEVKPATPADRVFEAVREKARRQQTVVVRPDGRFLGIPAISRESAPPEMLGTVERMLPSKVQRQVAVIAATGWTTGAASIQAANQAIPFFGMLMGFSTIGHAVWVFDGSAAMLSAGCREADVLIVDGACAESLPADWQDTAAKVMRNRQILVHDRTTYQLRKP